MGLPCWRERIYGTPGDAVGPDARQTFHYRAPQVSVRSVGVEGSVRASYTMTQCTMLHVQLADEPDREGSPFAKVHGLCQHCT